MIDALGHALGMAFAMGWEILWPLIGELHTGHMRGPRAFTYMYEGSAIPSPNLRRIVCMGQMNRTGEH